MSCVWLGCFQLVLLEMLAHSCEPHCGLLWLFLKETLECLWDCDSSECKRGSSLKDIAPVQKMFQWCWFSLDSVLVDITKQNIWRGAHVPKHGQLRTPSPGPELGEALWQQGGHCPVQSTYFLMRGVQDVPAKHEPLPGSCSCLGKRRRGGMFWRSLEVALRCVFCSTDPCACLQPGDQGGAACALRHGGA